MKLRCWQVSRRLGEASEIAPNCDLAYQTILGWTVTPRDGPSQGTGGDLEAQELDDHAGCSLCPSLDCPSSPKSST